MNAVPRLTVGLPVYNGDKYIAESLDALLGQSYTDFELIISDNASTDGTADICRRYEKQDSRVRYFRQPERRIARNHNFVAEQARGELFKWASDDDLYARDLLERCIDALDKYPDVVLAHSWTAKVDGSGTMTKAYKYPLTTASPRAPERFRSLLFDSGGDDDYGVMRIEVLRRTAMKESYHHADHTIVAEIALHGRFYQVPDWLYFRRDHDDRAERACPTMRSRCANMDPRRADRLRHPAVGDCTASTSGDTSGRSGMRRYHPRNGESATATWPSGWPAGPARAAPRNQSRRPCRIQTSRSTRWWPVRRGSLHERLNQRGGRRCRGRREVL